MNRLGIDFDSAKCLVPVIRYEDGAQWQNGALLKIDDQQSKLARRSTVYWRMNRAIFSTGPGHGVSAITTRSPRIRNYSHLAPTITGEQTLISAEALARTKTPPGRLTPKSI